MMAHANNFMRHGLVRPSSVRGQILSVSPYLPVDILSTSTLACNL
jgi:hypothetical protein